MRSACYCLPVLELLIHPSLRSYQLVDDTLDFIGDEGVMGKKGNGSDMHLGLTTGAHAPYLSAPPPFPFPFPLLSLRPLLTPPPSAPVLLAMEEKPRLRLLATRCFEHAGDVEEALQLVLSSSGIQRSRCNLITAPFLHLSLLHLLSSCGSLHIIYI